MTCDRSHPHDDPCPDHDLRTEVARLTNQLAHAEIEIRSHAATDSDWTRAHDLLDKHGVLTTPPGHCGVHLITRLEAVLKVWDAVGTISGARCHNLKLTCDDADTKAAIAAHRIAFRG